MGRKEEIVEDWEDSLEGQYTRLDGWFFTQLEQDVEQAERLLQEAKYVVVRNFARRTLVRTAFVQIEGLCASVQRWASYDLQHGGMYKKSYSDEEKAVLAGVYSDLDDKGSARFRRLHLPTASTIKFALELAGRGAHPPLKAIEYGDDGWEALKMAIEIRDRLMHPKVPHDVIVADAELRSVRRGRDWFMRTYRERQAAVTNHALRKALRRRRKKGGASKTSRQKPRSSQK